jgi:ATP-dependent Lon protease
MDIPFGVYKDLPVSINDGVDKCHEFIENAKSILDKATYGLTDAKIQIMQYIGQLITNPKSIGTCIAFEGPMGTGKTTLVKEGISKILNRPFAFFALGGATDSSTLEGHSITYEGSVWGKIVDTLKSCKCMNPVFYFDELDKISDTARGQEIIGILTHLTDTSQNTQFHDKYFSDIDFDISKCVFIFSYNEEQLVNPILRDRMYRIKTKGYDTKDKIIIAKKHLLPKIREQVNFNETDVIIPDDTLNYIITSQHLTKGESGVRNLKRCLEIIYTKLNLFRLIKPDNVMFQKDMEMNVSFPITITRKEVDVFIKKDDPVNQTLLSMYI